MKRKKIIGFLLLTFVCYLAIAQNFPALYRNTDRRAMDRWADSIFNSMTLDEKIGQMFMVVTDPRSASRKKVLDYIQNQKIGGILFSSGNLNDEAGSINLYQITSRIPLLISFDGEWGLSMRLKDTPRFPKNMMLGAVQNNDLIRLYGEEVGRECNELGVHINFAPVLDVNVNSENPVIGTRSFGENRELVAEKSIAYARGLEKKKVLSVGKHFPGHGDTSEDSHFVVPQIDASLARLDSVELYPFVRYIQAGFAGIMTGHLSVPALDSISGFPASLSPKIVTDVLTGRLGFEGLKITDALVMTSAVTSKKSVAVAAVLAGNDILLSPEKPANEFAAVKKAIESGQIKMSTIEESCRKILRYKYIVGLNRRKSILLDGLDERINSGLADGLVQKLNAEAITLLKNDHNSLPLRQLNKKIAVVALGDTTGNPFQQTLALYAHLDTFQFHAEENPDTLLKQLNSYNIILCGIHSQKISDLSALQILSKEIELHLCFFVSPYQLVNYEKIIVLAKSVILAYENTKYAQKAAAQVLMGGLAAKGKLPVTIAGLFPYQSGITTKKIRLSYQPSCEVGMSEDILRKITGIVKEGIDNQAFPGCQILVAKNGIVVYNQSFGYFDYEKTHPVQSTDLYDLASVTKAVATVPAIMKLYDSGKLRLHDPLSKYLPELKHTGKAKITIQDALFHETGLPAFLPFYKEADTCTNVKERMFRKIIETPEKKPHTYLYSDLNFILLKELVENISGQPLDRFGEQNFFADLGAYSTTFLPLKKIGSTAIAPTENDATWRKRLLIGEVHDETAAVLGGVSGNAGLFSNANDLAKLLQLFLNGGEYGGKKYISKETAQLFTQIQSPNSRRGLGFDKPDKMHEVGSTSLQAPASTYGHTGFTGTCFWVDPDNQLIYIFLSNRVYPSRTHNELMKRNIRPRIHDIIYQSIKKI